MSKCKLCICKENLLQVFVCLLAITMSFQCPEYALLWEAVVMLHLVDTRGVGGDGGWREGQDHIWSLYVPFFALKLLEE